MFSTAAALLMADAPALERAAASARVATSLGIPADAVNQQDWVGMMVNARASGGQRSAAGELAAVRTLLFCCSAVFRWLRNLTE